MKNRINAAYEEYSKGLMSKKQFIEAISPQIFKIPHLYNCFDEDIIAEYFTHILSSIDSFIINFNTQKNCKFKTWLICVLKKQYLQFIIKTNRNFALKSEVFLGFNLNNIVDEREKFNPSKTNPPPFGFPYSKLTSLEQDIIQLKFGNFNQTISTQLEDEQYTKIQTLEKRLTKSMFKIYEIQNKINKIQEKEKINELKLIEKDIKHRKKQNELRYKNLRNTRTNKDIAKTLNIAEGTVSCYLTKIRRKIRSHYHQTGANPYFISHE